jgi:hypothetical protein
MSKPKIPSTDSVEELAQFWDTHDATDFEDEVEEVTEPVFVRKEDNSIACDLQVLWHLDFMFLHVKQATHLKGYVLRIEFTDGVSKDVDLQGELYGEVFEPLRDPHFFEQVRVDEETGTVEWPNGADFAPEFLYEIGKEVKQVA